MGKLTTHFYVELILYITFIAIFIGIFYFTYVISVEKQIIKSQASLIANDFAASVNILPNNLIKSFKDNIQITDTKLDVDQIEHNNALRKKTYDTLFYVFISGILLSYFICEKNHYNYSTFLIKALIVLIFVGLTEYTFLIMVIKNYISADPNYIKYALLSSLNNSLNK